MSKKIPWINDGLVGFFEYRLQYKDITVVARNLEDLQTFLTREIFHKNTDKINMNADKIAIESYHNLSDEEKKSTNISQYRSLYVLEHRDEIINQLMEDGIIYPWDLSINDVKYESVDFTQDDIDKLQSIVDSCPNLTQKDLEDIFFEENTDNQEYLNYQFSLSVSQNTIDTYENDITTSEMICELYEKNLTSEEQLLANAEVIIELYEKINSDN